MPDQPTWSLLHQEARELHQRSADLIKLAHTIRCPKMIGGALCTADRYPEHEHRLDYPNDLPRRGEAASERLDQP